MVPSESGISEKEKIDTAMGTVGPLCFKIKRDLIWWKNPDQKKTSDALKESARGPSEKQLIKDEEDFWKWRDDQETDIKSYWRHVRTRLYFTSASHIYALFNIIHLGLESMLIQTQKNLEDLESIRTLQYLSYMVFKLYEDLNKDRVTILSLGEGEKGTE